MSFVGSAGVDAVAVVAAGVSSQSSWKSIPQVSLQSALDLRVCGGRRRFNAGFLALLRNAAALTPPPALETYRELPQGVFVTCLENSRASSDVLQNKEPATDSRNCNVIQ